MQKESLGPLGIGKGFDPCHDVVENLDCFASPDTVDPGPDAEGDRR